MPDKHWCTVGADDRDERIRRLTDEGNDLMALGQVEAAGGKFLEVLGLDEDHAMSWYNLAVTQSRSGDVCAAIDSYRRAVALVPGFVNAWNNLGMELLALDQIDEADVCFDRAIAADPDYPKSYNGKASVASIKGDNSSARRWLQMTLERDPTSVVAREGLRSLGAE